MLSIIESKSGIKSAQAILKRTIFREFTGCETRNIGYPGGTTRNARLRTDGTYWYWTGHHRDATIPRNLNFFGLMRDTPSVDISVEVNTPYQGTTGNVAGFFARDIDTNTTYLLHSGSIGGGTPGVGKFSFLTWSGEDVVEAINENGEIRKGVIVMPIDAQAATRSAKRYIDVIAEFKSAVREGITLTDEFRTRKTAYKRYFSEPRGRRNVRGRRGFDYISRHGDVVDALEEWRRGERWGNNYETVKDQLLDLGVTVGNQLREVFEVKTSATRYNLYTALGQLMVHGAEQRCSKYIVLPAIERIPQDVGEAIRRLDINILKFRLSENEVTIEGQL